MSTQQKKTKNEERYLDEWIGQNFLIEDCTYRVEFFRWIVNDGNLVSYNYYGYSDYELEDPVWIGNVVTGERLLKALNLTETIYEDQGWSSRIMYVIQKITKIDKDGNENELVPIEGKFDREAFLEQTIKIETDKTMVIFMINIEYCGKYILRRFSCNYEYTYCKEDSQWTEEIEGEMKVKDILEKLEIEPYHVYKGGMVDGPKISYPISIKFN